MSETIPSAEKKIGKWKTGNEHDGSPIEEKIDGGRWNAIVNLSAR
jgi:hypothetical protein